MQILWQNLAQLCNQSKPENTAAMNYQPPDPPQYPRLMAITHNYSHTILEQVEVYEVSTVALLDLGARGANFMDRKFADAIKITYTPAQYFIRLASASKSCQVVGNTDVTLKLRKRTNQNVKMYIVSELICDVI